MQFIVIILILSVCSVTVSEVRVYWPIGSVCMCMQAKECTMRYSHVYVCDGIPYSRKIWRIHLQNVSPRLTFGDDRYQSHTYNVTQFAMFGTFLIWRFSAKRQIAKLKSSPNFLAIRYAVCNLLHRLYMLIASILFTHGCGDGDAKSTHTRI